MSDQKQQSRVMQHTAGLKRKPVPAYVADTVRLGVALAIFFVLPLILHVCIRDKEKVMDYVFDGFYVGAITCVVCNLSVIGDQAGRVFERCIGTISGGLSGFVVVKISESLGLLVPAAALVPLTASFVFQKNGYDYSGKAFVISYCMVQFGTAIQGGVAEWVFLTRTGGTLLGLLTFYFLSTFIFPTAASEKAFGELKKAAEALREANTWAWQGPLLSRLTSVHNQQEEASTAPSTTSSVAAAASAVGSTQAEVAKVVVAVQPNNNESGDDDTHPDENAHLLEQAVNDYRKSMAGYRKFLGPAKLEMDLWHRLYIPVPWPHRNASNWHMPHRQMAAVEDSMRNLTVALRTLQWGLSYDVHDKVVDRLNETYRADALLSMRELCMDVMQDIVSHMPDDLHNEVEEAVPEENLYRLTVLVDYIVNTSYNMHHTKKLLFEPRPDEVEAAGGQETMSHSSSLPMNRYVKLASQPGFPDGIDGYAAHVHWYSFIFILTEYLSNLIAFRDSVNLLLQQLHCKCSSSSKSMKKSHRSDPNFDVGSSISDAVSDIVIAVGGKHGKPKLVERRKSTGATEQSDDA